MTNLQDRPAPGALVEVPETPVSPPESERHNASTEEVCLCSPPPVRAGRSWTFSKRAREMVAGEVYHALRREGHDKAVAKAAAGEVKALMRLLPEVSSSRHKDPRLAQLSTDRKALAQALAMVFLLHRNRRAAA